MGGEGVPVYTHLERESQPMIRYWSEYARWEMVDCPCGRTYPPCRWASMGAPTIC